MNEQKNLFSYLSDWWGNRKAARQSTHDRSRWLPTPGNIIFSFVLVVLLICTQRTWATSIQTVTNVPGPSATTVNYQGRLANPDGTPVSDGTYGMTFALYDVENGGTPVWSEGHTAVPVSGGLFSVGLGSQTSGGIPTTTWNGDRYLEITVGGETLSPRELIRSVPIAGMALTVPSGAIGTEQVADGAITNMSQVTIGPGAGNLTSTSTTFVDIPGYEVTLNTTGGPVMLLFQANVRGDLGEPGDVVCLDFAIDGVRVGQNQGISRIVSYSITESATTVWVAHPPAGTHTFKVQWKVDEGTGTEALLNQEQFANQFSVIELKK